MIDLNMPAGLFTYDVDYIHKVAMLRISVDAFNPAEAQRMALVHLEQLVQDVSKWVLHSVVRH